LGRCSMVFECRDCRAKCGYREIRNEFAPKSKKPTLSWRQAGASSVQLVYSKSSKLQQAFVSPAYALGVPILAFLSVPWLNWLLKGLLDQETRDGKYNMLVRLSSAPSGLYNILYIKHTGLEQLIAIVHPILRFIPMPVLDTFSLRVTFVVPCFFPHCSFLLPKLCAWLAKPPFSVVPKAFVSRLCKISPSSLVIAVGSCSIICFTISAALSKFVWRSSSLCTIGSVGPWLAVCPGTGAPRSFLAARDWACEARLPVGGCWPPCRRILVV